MNNIYVINGHEPYSFSPGNLNAELVSRTASLLGERGYHVDCLKVTDPWQNEQEVEKHLWADVVVLQFPVNWMGVPWSLKRYIDLVYTAGIGTLCSGDGRSREDLAKQYGGGGLLQGKKYMLSATFNAPESAFNDTSQQFFRGKNADDLFWPIHLTYEFLAMRALPSFVCYDVMKNPQIENDFDRLEQHLIAHFPVKK